MNKLDLDHAFNTYIVETNAMNLGIEKHAAIASEGVVVVMAQLTQLINMLNMTNLLLFELVRLAQVVEDD